MGALSDLKILDFSTLLPGPYATMVLADMGAEVLTVSGKDKWDLVVNWPPQLEGGDVTAAWGWLGRNKKNIFLNLKKPAAIEAVKKLVKEYDIVMEQFRPGVMEKLGLGYEELKKENPRLIYCSLTGYGQSGELRDKAGHDINYIARSGIANAAGRKDGGPSLYNFQIADVAAGSMNAITGILAAVHYRDVTGKGQYIDIAMLDGVIPFHSMDGASALGGAPVPKREEQMLNGGSIYDFYETADGRYMSVGSLEPKFFAALCKVMGHEEWADGKILKEDPALAKQTFAKQFRSKALVEWIELFKEADACVEPVATMEEAMADPHLIERNMWVKVPLSNDPAKSALQMGTPLKLSETPPSYRHAAYPTGYHTEEILQRLGYSAKEIVDMTD